MPPPPNESRGQAAVAGLRTTTAYTVVGPADSHVVGTRWFTVERADGAGRGLLVAFDARLVPDARRHLERLTALRDPQLAQIVAYGVDDGTAWVIYSGTLDDSLEVRSGPLSMNEIVGFGDALLGSLARAHQAGFVHPGITEALVRMTPGLDGQPKPEMLGLGLPLPLDRGPQDDLADVAFILYHLYMGRPPFEPGVPRDGSVRPSPFRVGRSGAAASPAFEAAVMRALGPRAEAFPTADDMRLAMGAVPVKRTGPAARPRTDPHMRRALVEPHAAPMPPSTVSTLPTREAPSGAPAPARHGVRWGPIALAAIVLVALGWWIASLGDEPKPGAETELAARDPIRWSAPPPTDAPDVATAVAPPVVAEKPPPPKKKPLPRIAMVIESTPLEPPEPPPAKAPEPTAPVVAEGPAPGTPNAESVTPTDVTRAGTVEPGASGQPTIKPTPKKPTPKTEPLAPTPEPPRLAEATTTPPPDTTPPAEVAPPPETTPPPDQVVTRRVRIVTKPAGVTVKARGKVLGVTPVTLDLPLADLPIDLVFEKRGYRASRRTVTAVEEIMLDMQADPTAPSDPPGTVPNPG